MEELIHCGLLSQRYAAGSYRTCRISLYDGHGWHRRRDHTPGCHHSPSADGNIWKYDCAGTDKCIVFNHNTGWAAEVGY